MAGSPAEAEQAAMELVFAFEEVLGVCLEYVLAMLLGAGCEIPA